VNLELSVRTANSTDVEAIATLINAAFRVEQFFIDGDRIATQEIRERQRAGDFLVAEKDVVLVGCVYYELRGQRAYIGLLSVHPSRQRSGVGSTLMRAAEDRARQASCAFADLRVVNLRQELPGFYKRLGYLEIGTEQFPPDVPTKLPCHFVIMSKALAKGDRRLFAEILLTHRY
jgi:predicted N-acetyltransferase YhbS